MNILGKTYIEIARKHMYFKKDDNLKFDYGNDVKDNDYVIAIINGKPKLAIYRGEPRKMENVVGKIRIDN